MTAEAGEHQDRRAHPSRARLPQHIEAAPSGKLRVEHDEIKPRQGNRLLEPFIAVLLEGHVESLRFKVEEKSGAELRVVFDDEETGDFLV
jgi:hypothetical protein